VTVLCDNGNTGRTVRDGGEMKAPSQVLKTTHVYVATGLGKFGCEKLKL